MWILRERLRDFREKRVCKQFKEGLNKSYTELIVFLYIHKIAIIFDHSRLGLENKLFLNKITQLLTYTPPWYFISCWLDSPNYNGPRSPGRLYQNEVKCSVIDMKMAFHSHANKTHFHKKGCAVGLISKVRVFGTRNWPILRYKGWS